MYIYYLYTYPNLHINTCIYIVYFIRLLMYSLLFFLEPKFASKKLQYVLKPESISRDYAT